jgi:competence ComEA-like helix-hairpin-helix protein
MEEQTRQIRFLIVIAAVICAVMIGYNAFYVPDAPLSEPTVTADLPSVSSTTEEYIPSSVAAKSSAGRAAVSSRAGSKTAGKVNINTATAQELSEKLKGVGESLAERIVAYREKHGRFQSVEEIKNVSGIGSKKYESIRNSIVVE